jgi:putative peptidoglycan lipid II flippase
LALTCPDEDRMSFARAAATVGGLTMLSRLAGFARDVLTAALLGAGPAADAFFVALKLPNLLRRLFAEGVFTVAFVPLFSAELQSRGRAAAMRFAEEALSLLLAVLLPLTIAAVAAMPWILPVLAPGFVGDAERFPLAVELSRIAFPYLPLVSAVALLGGVLNALDRFGPFAAAPIAFNLTLIAALLLAGPLGAEPAHALAWGVAAAGVVQVLWLGASCRAAGVRLRLALPRPSPRLGRLLRLLGPGAIGVGIMQINGFVNIFLASLLPTGAVSFLYYADRLNQLPLGVIGIAVGTALLPMLSRHVEAGDRAAIREGLSRGLEGGLLLALPAAAALALLAEPIIAVLFGRGAFGPDEVRATAAALACYAIGIPAYIAVKVLGVSFFARQDTAAPLRAGLVAALANAGIGLASAPLLGHVGIALASGISAWINAGLLAWGLHRRGHLDIDRRLIGRMPRIAAATSAMAAALWAALPVLGPAPAGPALAAAGGLACLTAGGLLAFLAAAQALGAVSLSELRGLLRRETPPAAPPAA